MNPKLIFLALFAMLLFSCVQKNENNELDSKEIIDLMDNYSNSISEDHTPLIGNEKGAIAPDFEITTIDGKEIKLSSLRGSEPVLLYFWASWCPYCSEDLDIVKNVYSDYSGKVEFLAIDMDLSESEKKVRDYRDKKQIDGADFALGKESILSDYSIIHTTTKYAIGRNGTVLYKSSGVFNEEQWKILLNGLAKS